MGCCYRLGPQASASPLRPPRLRPPLGRGRSYRASRGGDYEAELEHKDDIAAARKESSQLSRMGELKGALKALQKVEPWLCDSTELGGRTLLELGWAYDATGDREMGRKIMARLRQHPSKEIRRASQQLAFQDEASEFLGVKEFGTDGPSEYEKLSRLPRVKGIKRYNLLDAPTASLKRPPVDTLSEARMTLRSAAVRRGDNGAPTRLQQSITYITKKARLSHYISPVSPLYLPYISPASPRRRRAVTRRSRSCPTAARRARARC